MKRLIDPMRPITYGIVQAGEDVPGGVPYIRPVDMAPFARDLDPSLLRTTAPEIAATYGRSTVRAGDLVVSIGPSYGKSLLASARLAGCNLTQGTARLAPAPGVSGRFLQWALKAAPARAHWDAAVGGATFGGLNLGPLSTTPVPLHSTERQRRIADFLDREAARVDTLMRELTTFRDDMVRQHYERQRSDLLSQGPSVALKYLIEAPQNGDWGGEPGTDEVDVGCVRVTDFDRPRLAFRSRGVIRSYSRRTVDRLALQAQDLVLEKSGGGEKSPVGFVVRCSESVAGLMCSNFVARLRPLRGTDAAWLAHVLGTLYASGHTHSFVKQVTGIQNLDAPAFLRTPVPQIPLADQRRIGEGLDRRLGRALAARDEIEVLLDGLREYQASLITEAVTGELDVSEIGESQMEESLAAVREGEAPEVLAR